MRRIDFAFFLTALLLSVANAQIPNTPAGRQFAAWRAAQDSGDRAKIQRFLDTSLPFGGVEQELAIHQQTGGFDIKGVEQSSDFEIVVLVQTRNPPHRFARVTMGVEAAEPHRIARLSIQNIQPPDLAEFPITPMSDTMLASALRAWLEKEAAADLFAGTALVAHNGKVIFSGAYGLADRGKRAPNTLDTQFRIGSMNKMFTATCMLQLVQSGKVRLSDPLGKYITDYPNPDVGAKVTIHQLLTHTGGTGDFFGPEFEEHRLELKSLDDYVKLFGKRGIAFEPGSKYAYSNYGMLLAGVVIERVSGQSYYDYVAENIYKRAGMTLTASQPENEAVTGRAVGYMRPQGQNTWTPNTNTLPYRGTSAGGGYSTVGDLLKFAQALISHKLLNAENTSLLMSGKVDAGDGAMYAYGFEDARKKDGSGWVGHSGGAPGMNGDLRIFPKSGYVVAVLSNLDPPAASEISRFVSVRLPTY
jgi:CubicO group peptidase (beta-lactamase class C family)